MPDLLRLTEEHKAILDFEAQKPLWNDAGAKNAAIHEELGLQPADYYSLLDRLIDQRAAARHAPQTVHRLRAERERRRTPRSPWRAS